MALGSYGATIVDIREVDSTVKAGVTVFTGTWYKAAWQ